MTKQKHIDLHMHSTVSDGTNTPSEILSLVAGAGLDHFSLTDHDAIRGCAEIREQLDALSAQERERQPRFISGVEFSCKDEEGKYHILGYRYDLAAPSISAVVEQGHAYRMKKVQARLDFLKESFGFSFSEEDLAALFALDNPGKPHIGNLMVKYGYAQNRTQAIREFIDQKRFRSEYVRPEDAIRGILDAGGIPVLAHGAYGSGDQLILGEELETRVRRLATFGLAGVEAYYSGFTQKIQEQMLEIAARLDLYVTAGSDYHGTNKMIVLGDTNLKSVADAVPGLHRFLEAAFCQ